MIKGLLMMALGCFVALTAPGRILPLDLRAPEAGTKGAARGLALQQANPDGTLRKTNLEAGVADLGMVEVGDTLSLTLFENVSIDLVLTEKMPSPLGGDAFIAEASGYEGIKNAVVLRTADGLTVDIQDYRNKKVYKVVSTATGVTVEEIEAKGSGTCGCDALEPPVQDEAPKVSAAPATLMGTTPADTCVDILVAFDVNAAAWAKANGGGVTNFAQTAVQKMNTALANTGLDSRFRFRLVGVATLAVSASTVHDALEAIKDNRTGWNAVKTARDAVGADIVTTLVDTGSAYGTTGVGQSLASGTSPSSFAESAYNVCAIRSVAISHTMTHECGHNMGAGHSDIQVSQPGPQLYTYSSGYYFTADGGSYCTIMAYDSENPSGEFSTQVPFFSSPSYTYEGTTVGDSTHDNTKTLANTYAAAAAWRAQKVAMSYDVNFSPASGSIINGSLSVTLSTGKSGTSIRYTLDGSNPTLSSPLYSSSIALTRTTTIKAISVTDGKASMPFEASYYSKDDIGYATGLTDLKWSLSVPSTSTLGVQTEKTIDGVALGATVKSGDVCTFSTTIVGPATISWRSLWDGDYIVRVMCDGSEVFSDYTSGYIYDWLEEPQFADIPAGSHTVQFRLGASTSSGYYLYYDSSDYWFDDFQIHYVQKPTFSPATSDSAGTAATFTGEQMVTLRPPNANCQVYYTLDGSDPNGKDAILYEGPFFINASTRVRAIAVQPGKGSSGIVSGLYLEQHAVRAGEWTLWGDGAYQAAKSGRMIAELCWDLTWCYWSQKLEPVVASDAFTTWAAANGVYLLADSWGDIPGTGSRFWDFYADTDLRAEMGGVAYPTFVFVNGGGSRIGAMLARNDNEHQVNGIYYRDTLESLIASFASVLGGGTPLAAPVPSVTDASGKTYPFSVTLSNPNGSGTIYYTLDGSAPTREKGTRYTGAISIPSSGTTLKAVVWPSSTSAVSGVPLAITYQSLSSVVGVDGVTWQNDASRPWTVTQTSSGVTFNGYKKKDLTSGSLSSTIKASVKGPGLVKFKYTISTRGGSDLAFKVNGSEVESSYYAYNKGFSYRIESSDTTELSWTYVYYYLDESDAYPCEVKDFEWIPFASPKAVGGLTASQGSYDYGVVLRWKASANAKSYAIYRSDANASSGATLIGTTEKCQYWDASAVPGWTYWYWVKAVNDYGQSGFSSGVSGRKKSGSTTISKVTFDSNGGVFSGANFGSMDGKSGTAAVPLTYGKGSYGSGMRATKSGAAFQGWWTATSGGTPQYDANGKCVPGEGCWNSAGLWNLQGNAKLYARFGGPHALKFDSNGGTFDGGNFGSMNGKSGVAQVSVTCGKGAYSSGMRATMAGAKFLGWWTAKTGGSMQYDANGKFVGNSTCWTASGKWRHHANAMLYARWESSGEPHALKFDANGGVFAGANFGSMNGKSGTAQISVTCGKGSYNSGMRATRSGYTFQGWWTATSGGSMQYDANGKFVGNSTCWTSDGKWQHHGNAALYARWSADEPHGLAFDPNGGVLSGANFGAANGTSAKTQVWVTCGKGSYSAGMRATKVGATFKGWWTAPTTGGSMQYDANGKFVPNSTCWDASGKWKHHGNATLYARWQ